MRTKALLYSVCTAEFIEPNCVRTFGNQTSGYLCNVQVRPELVSKQPSLEEIDILYESSFQSISSRLVFAAIKYIQVKIFSIRNCWTLQQMSHAWAIINREMEEKQSKYTASYQDVWSMGKKSLRTSILLPMIIHLERIINALELS